MAGQPPIGRVGYAEIVKRGFPESVLYRDQAGNEVDLVMERASGEVIGVEVKTSANPRPRDASGLRLLRDKLGDRFRCGLLLHLGPDSIPIGERISAVPLAAIWESGSTR